MRYLKGETFGQRYGLDPTGLVLWLDQSDPRSYGDVGNWYDLSGQGNHAVQAVGGSQPVITGATSLAGSCRSFDGAADHIETVASTDFDIHGQAPLTIAAWINLDALPGVGEFCIPITFTEDPNNGVFDKQIRIDENGEAACYAWDGAARAAVKAAAIVISTWYHIVGTYDGVNLRVWVDGVEGVPDAAAATHDFNTPIIQLSHEFGDRIYVDGLIAAAYIFSRALTPAEIQRMYLIDKPRYGGL